MSLRKAVALIIVMVMLLSSSPVVLASTGTSDHVPQGTETDDVPMVGTAVTPETRAGNGEFIENLGQWDEGIEYMARGPGCDVAFHADGVMYLTRTGGLVQAVKVSFGGGTPRVPVGSSPTGTSRNYILGNDPSGWVTGVGSYRSLTYEDVWSGIDVRYTVADRGLKYDVLVGPDADPDAVRFDVSGGDGLTVSGDGLAIELARGATIHDVELVAWYGDGEPVEATFRAVGDGYGFSVEKEPGRALVIDPLVIIASTLLGGTYQDEAAELALDHRGDVIVAGTTQSTDFPVTEGVYSETYREDCLVVTKMDRNLTTVIWSTYIGGTGEDAIKDIDLDDEGNIYLTGLTKSADFPVSEGALQTTIGATYSGDLYVLKLTSDGTSLEYSTFIGGLYGETPGGICVRDGKAYVAAMTESANFPYGNISAWFYNGIPFVMVLSEDGTTMETIQSWKITRGARPEAIEVDQDGTVTISGFTGSLDLPTTPGAYMNESNWNPRSFIIQCDPWTNRTLMCTYFSIGGAYIEHMAMDGEGNIYIAGLAYNRAGGVELTEGAWCTTYKGSRDLFLTKMDPNASRVIYSTLIGGNSYDFSGDLAVTEDGIAVFGGWCWDATGFETSENAHDRDTEGVYEGFVVVLNENGSSPILSTFLGGTHGDFVTAVEMTPDYTPLLAGHTESKVFPVTEGAYQEEHAGDRDMFVMEYACLYPPGVPMNLTAKGGDGNISLEWQPPLDTNRFPVVNYSIYRMEEDGELELYRVSGPTTSFLDEDVEYGVYYTYGVTAFNGKGISLMSGLAKAWTVTVPDPPVNLTGTVYPDHMKLTWDTPDFKGGLPLDEYNVYRSVGDGELELIAHVHPYLDSFVDTDVQDTVTYTYVLAATNGQGESEENPSVTMRMTGVPTPPLALDHTYGERYIEVNWTEPLEHFDLPVVRYHVFRGQGGGDPKLVGVVNAPALVFRDKAVEVGVTYRYHVVAENAKGMSPASAWIEAMTMVRPDAPQGVAATSHDLFVRVTWEAPDFDGASPLTSYRVYLVDEDGGPVLLGDVNVVGVSEPRLVFLHEVAYDAVARSYHVTALNVEGESDPSMVAVTQMFEPPARPRFLEAEVGDGEVTLTWSPPELDGGTPVRSYAVFRSLADGDTFIEMATLPASTLRYEDGSVANGVEYDYWVTAWNLAGESDSSTTVRVMPAGPPDPPEGLVTEGHNGSVIVQWEPPQWNGGQPVLGYRLYMLSNGTERELLFESGPEQREFLHEDLVNGRVYRYAVQAFSVAGGSELSPVVEGLPAGAPSEPQALIAVWMDGMVYVTWSNPADNGGSPVIGYRIRRTDWGPGNWTDVPAFSMMFSDEDVDRNATYNYTLYAVNDVGGSSVVRVSITTPPPVEPDDDETMGVWPWLLVGASIAVLVAAVLYLRRPRPLDLGTEEAEETEETEETGDLEDIEDVEADEDVVDNEDVEVIEVIEEVGDIEDVEVIEDAEEVKEVE